MFVAVTVLLSCLLIADVAQRSYAKRRSALVQARIMRSIDRGHRT
ncbi:hypothetical protein [Sulfitobacter pacificus]